MPVPSTPRASTPAGAALETENMPTSIPKNRVDSMNFMVGAELWQLIVSWGNWCARAYDWYLCMEDSYCAEFLSFSAGEGIKYIVGETLLKVHAFHTLGPLSLNDATWDSHLDTNLFILMYPRDCRRIFWLRVRALLVSLYVLILRCTLVFQNSRYPMPQKPSRRLGHTNIHVGQHLVRLGLLFLKFYGIFRGWLRLHA